jgi:A/G-specific adenine glycosylase
MPTSDSDSRELDEDPAWRARVRSRLLAWYAREYRQLPWRNAPDAYSVLVSEMMLVQTTVVAVVPYYERFLARFPTVAALAQADAEDVLKAWEGLGYYRRARQLHEAARVIMREHSGKVPDDSKRLLALPGVGRYIAGAVLSMAYNRPAAIVEANSERVLARLIAWEGELSTARSRERLWRAAERLVSPVAPGRFNQALMDVGAAICIPRDPLCLVCPLTADCGARRMGRQGVLPRKAARPPVLEVFEACALVERAGRLLVVRRAAGGLWSGFWEFPTIHLRGADPAGRGFGEPVDLPEGVRRLTGIHTAAARPIRTIRFGVTRHRVLLTAHRATWLGGRLSPGPGLDRAAWVTPDALGGLAMGSAQRRLAATAHEELRIARSRRPRRAAPRRRSTGM